MSNRGLTPYHKQQSVNSAIIQSRRQQRQHQEHQSGNRELVGYNKKTDQARLNLIKLIKPKPSIEAADPTIKNSRPLEATDTDYRRSTDTDYRQYYTDYTFPFN